MNSPYPYEGQGVPDAANPNALAYARRRLQRAHQRGFDYQGQSQDPTAQWRELSGQMAGQGAFQPTPSPSYHGPNPPQGEPMLAGPIGQAFSSNNAGVDPSAIDAILQALQTKQQAPSPLAQALGGAFRQPGGYRQPY